jgi:hypothetical protein
MKHNYHFIFLIFLVGLSSSWVGAQNQIGEEISNITSSAPFAEDPTAPWGNGLSMYRFEILDSSLVDIGCDTAFKYSVSYRTSSVENPSSSDKSFWPTLPGGPGMQKFTARIQWKVWKSYYVYRFYEPNWDVYINGELCTECYTEVVNESGVVNCPGIPTEIVTVHYPATDEYDTNGEWEFALKPHLTAAWNCNEYCCGPFGACTNYCQIGFDGNTTIADNVFPEIRFNAIMAGVSFSDILGTFTTPQTLTCILRDPPGDASYSTWGQSTTQCFGSTFFSSTETEESAYIKVKYGIGVPGVFGAEIEGTLSASMTETNSETNEVRTCVEALSTTSTSPTGPPDDLFIGNAILYNYGMASTITRAGCVTTKTHGFAMAPLSQASDFAYPESEIRGTIIPQLEAILEIFSPGSIQYEDNLAQLEVWEQALAMNDEIKAEAQSANVPAELFVSGGSETYSLTTTTTESKIIDMKVRLSAGIDATLTADLPWGGGVDANYQFNIRTEYGQSESSSIEYSNTSSYYMSDDDAAQNGGNDNFSVNIMQDKVFGTFVFALDETVSRTSCPYEGGIPIEQPQLWVDSEGESSMTLDNVPVDGVAQFPIYLCNDNPTRTVEYLLTVNNLSNENNAILTALGNPLSGTAQQLVEVAPNSCQTATLSLQQLNNEVLNYDDIEIILTSGCGDTQIKSSILVSANFTEDVGINKINAANAWFTVSPNPSNGIFRFISKGTNQTMTISVTDLLGRTVFAPTLTGGSGNTEIDLSHVSNGMYVLIAERDGERKTTRLMVEH